ncbi:hypothetical protein TCEL_00467 [Thermobrachium celere DSM 8682]|uniref:Uncharacterized protein n=1 Tax=Thermobrachium celere DSM 8682 TaxID=941824 RepID=R7RSR3_9CLOT|nr:hypothetical protein TCEL_00467 [Thermobrachium celere DSM 8682]
MGQEMINIRVKSTIVNPNTDMKVNLNIDAFKTYKNIFV